MTVLAAAVHGLSCVIGGSGAVEDNWIAVWWERGVASPAVLLSADDGVVSVPFVGRTTTPRHPHREGP